MVMNADRSGHLRRLISLGPVAFKCQFPTEAKVKKRDWAPPGPCSESNSDLSFGNLLSDKLLLDSQALLGAILK